MDTIPRLYSLFVNGNRNRGGKDLSEDNIYMENGERGEGRRG